MEIKKENDKFIFQAEFSTLEDYADLVWAGREHKHPQVRKDQVQYWCMTKIDGKDQLIVLRTVRDSNVTLRDRVIQHDCDTGNELGIGMAVLGMFSDDKPQEPRWEYLGDYELIGFSGEFPIVKKKDNG